MQLDELKVGSLIQLNKVGRRHFSSEEPDTTVLVLKINDCWILALHGEAADIKIYYAELQYFDVVSNSGE